MKYEPIDIGKFAHLSQKGTPLAIVENLEILFEYYDITCSYDVILKKQSIEMDESFDGDLSNTATIANIQSLLALNRMPKTALDLLPVLMSKKAINPVLDWIKSKKWDNIDRISDLISTLGVDEQDFAYRNKAVLTWLVQCVAALDSAKSTPIKHASAKYELVLVLQGNQGIGKTTWFKSLLPKHLSDLYIKDGLHLDPADKDTVKKAISAWICELGEIDATFRKADIARLKAFLSNEYDEIRLPYDRAASLFKRRTSFCASVNPNEFLSDNTGNRRFMPIAVKQCYETNEIDMQQLWAQVFDVYQYGAIWWCDKELESMLVSRHEQHAEVSPIAELLAYHFNTEQQKTPRSNYRFDHYSATQLLIECGINQPTKQQVKDCKAYVERLGFVQSKIRGYEGYWLTKDKEEYANEYERYQAKHPPLQQATKKCGYCRADFTPDNAWDLFCSTNCKDKAYGK